MDVRIGTAGYAYPAWVGGFYPRGTSQQDMLPYFAAQFPAVEINNSFYRPPTPEQIEKMARRTPVSFAFTLKVPKSVSHDRSDDDLEAFKLAVMEAVAAFVAVIPAPKLTISETVITLTVRVMLPVLPAGSVTL